MIVKRCDNCKKEKATWPPGWIKIDADPQGWDAFAHTAINGDYCSFHCAIAVLQRAMDEQVLSE